jgi:hypothetical protein
LKIIIAHYNDPPVTVIFLQVTVVFPTICCNLFCISSITPTSNGRWEVICFGGGNCSFRKGKQNWTSVQLKCCWHLLISLNVKRWQWKHFNNIYHNSRIQIYLLLKNKFVASMINLLFFSVSGQILILLMGWLIGSICTCVSSLSELERFEASFSIQLYLNDILPGAILSNTNR